jgi:hypothetical protein
LHFLDGTPTAIDFDLARDEPAVLDWIGLPALEDGQRQWLDLAARTVESASPPARGAKGHSIIEVRSPGSLHPS